MAKALNAESAAGRMKVCVEIKEREPKGTSTVIQNNSGRTIFLIPVSCVGNGYTQGNSTVCQDRAQKIPVGGPTKVDIKKLDFKEHNSGRQCYILFRAGDKNNVKKELRDYPPDRYPRGDEVKPKETVFYPSQLFQMELCLTCAEENIGDSNADQGAGADADATQNESQLVDLIKDALAIHKQLEKKLKDLQKGMKIPMEAWE